MCARRAFSLIELLTALVLLSVGLAAFARAAAGVARLEADALLRREVAGTLLARLDTLEGRPCGESASGVNERRGVREVWTASAAGRRFVLSESIGVAARPNLGRSLTTSVACRP